MGWNAIPGLVIITAVWVGTGWGMDKIHFWREEKREWSYQKDQFQKALLRRDWYLHREQEDMAAAK